MRAACIVVLLVSGVSANTSGCAADLDEEIPPGDATTLLQLNNLMSSWLGQDADAPDKKKNCPTPCTLNDWGDWGACSKTCGKGERTRSRTVKIPATNKGKCDPTEESLPCLEEECPVPCKTSEWDEWSACSATCGDGTKTRSRTVTEEAKHGGLCGKLDESRDCNIKPCPTPCKTSDWGDWSGCSKTCGEGTRTRSRTVTAEAQHGGKCDEALDASETCKEKECIIPCKLSDWSDWSKCSAACGVGTKTRSRTITADAQHGGPCGKLDESTDCEIVPCPTPCKLSDWTDWSGCSKTCGKGTRTRSRTVTVEAQHGGKCDEAKEASEMCIKKECEIPCVVSEWEDWSDCSATCGDGTKTRSRTVTVEAQHGGKCDDELDESKPCKKIPCPVPCKVSDWGDWSDCSKKCGQGTRKRFRTVIDTAQHGGKCDDALEASEKCTRPPCPVPCKVSEWDEWSDCSATCGVGTKTRSRTVIADAKYGGTCDDDLSDSKKCEKIKCPIPCKMSDWTDWSGCSKTCGVGTRTRSRTVTAEAQHGGKCDEATEAKEECKKGECAIPCVVSDWDDWSACSATCGDGTKTRSRTIVTDAKHGGTCKKLDESLVCKIKPCPTPCKTSDWGDWSGCSTTCGEGTKTRSRTVTAEAQHGGKCDEALEAKEKCKEEECPIPCKVSEWDEWSACSAKCGGGTKTRSRTVITEAQHGGTCKKLEETHVCNIDPCPVPCKMSDWGDWTACSETCGKGVRTRSRTVTAEAQHGGKCDESTEAKEECKEEECPIPCIVSEWDEWSACSATCGDGTKTRSRTIVTDAKFGGTCKKLDESLVCNIKPCPTPCKTSDWGDWSGCSTTCGEGTRTRSRTVTAEAQHGGKCDEALEASEKCKEDECPKPCKVSDWGEWNDCTHSCGGGTKTRFRTITADAQHGGPCPELQKLDQKEDCNQNTCPVDCELCNWEDWGPCSTTCGPGTRTRSRTVEKEAQDGGTCGDLEEDGACNEKECPVDPLSDVCEMSEWSAWTACTKTCGSGTRKRSREVLSVKDEAGECPCLEEADTCNAKPCPEEPVKPQGDKIEVKGTVKDAKSNSPIKGATVQIPSQGLTTTTGSEGEFTFESVEVGDVVVVANGKDWANRDYREAEVQRTIEEGMGDINIKMVLPLAADEWVIILTWEKQPQDLESVTTFGNCELKPYPADLKECTDGGMSGKIDIDNNAIESMPDKPETTTLTGVTGKVAFSVENWVRINQQNTAGCKDDKSQCKAIAVSKAIVDVYGPSTRKTYKVPQDGTLSDDGKYWYVFSMDA